MKSKYPNQLDTSSEIPVVRDGITEISSEIFNSLRSAIIQIEKTLGINPQGSAGLTVGDRISASLDQSGNLSRDALERANVLLGQLTNDNVAANAAIEESKLKLVVPTTVIQSQVSGILNLIDSLSSKIEELSASYTVHVSPYATNRHKATSISVASAELTDSDIATTSLQSGDLQTTIENIYSSHINFIGQTSAENRSHTAEQIYFDNTIISEITSAANLQNAVEDIASINSEALKDSFSYLNSNGITIFGKKYSSYEGFRLNDVCIQPSEVSFLSSSLSFTTVTFTTPHTPAMSIEPFDLLKLEGTTDSLDDREYFIKSILLDGSNKIISVDIFSKLKTDSTGFAFASIFKNSYDYNNKNGLNSTVRPRISFTNTPELAICHPNSATIISTGINTSKISESLSSFKITADEYKELDVNVYNSDINFDEQSIDSIVVKLNEEFISNNFPALAYKLKMPTCYELAISHIIPDLSSDSIKRSLKISAADSQDCTTELGFSNVLDVVHFGKYGNPLHINGTLSKDFYQIDVLDSTQINTVISTQRLSLVGKTFRDFGTEVGDTVYIYSPANPLDEIVARVKTVTGSNIDLDLVSFSFSGNLNGTSKVFLIKNTVKLSDLNFEIVSSSTGYMLVDSLFDRNNTLFYNKRCEISKYIQNGGLLLTVVDISQGYLLNSQITLTTNSSGEVFITNEDLIDGEKTYIFSSGEYLVRSPENDGYLTVRAVYTSAPTSTVVCDVAGFYEHTQDIYHISRFIFGPTLGRIYGFFGTPGIPNIIDKRIFGTVSTKQISSGFIEKYIEQPRHDLRGTGVISGLEISSILIDSDSNGAYVSFAISSGVAIVNGVRFSIGQISEYKYYTESDIYIVINRLGCIEILQPDFLGNSPTVKSNIYCAMLYALNVDGSIFPPIVNNEKYFDLRFFVDRLDYKVSKEIIVSTDPSEGHFTKISDAVKYAHFYSKIYKTSGLRSSGGPTIKIRDGVYEINETILINIDLQIVGSGQSTIIRRGQNMANAGSIYNEFLQKINIDLDKVLFLIGGDGLDNALSNIEKGVTFRNFTYETISEYTGASAVIAVAHNIGTDSIGFYQNTPIFRFESINFYGPQSLSITPTSEKFEYAIVLTQSYRPTRSITSAYFGNLIVNSCYFSYMGDEDGIIKTIVLNGLLTGALSKIKNIVCTGNIADHMAPNGSSGARIVSDDYSFIETINIIEANNALND